MKKYLFITIIIIVIGIAIFAGTNATFKHTTSGISNYQLFEEIEKSKIREVIPDGDMVIDDHIAWYNDHGTASYYYEALLENNKIFKAEITGLTITYIDIVIFYIEDGYKGATIGKVANGKWSYNEKKGTLHMKSDHA